MTFIAQTYNKGFLNGIQEILERTKDAKEKYGVRIVEADVPEGRTYWRVVGVHHLLPEENRGNRNVFLDILDEEGRRINRPTIRVHWTWEGRNPVVEAAPPVQMDKPLAESGGNISMQKGQTISVWVVDAETDEPSDRVENIHTLHADEFLSSGSAGATGSQIGHHSFYIVFQRARKEGAEVATASIGVIRGRIAEGWGYTVRLFQGNRFITEQTVGDDLAFKFEQLAPGAYRLEATSPSLHMDGLWLDTSHPEATVQLSAVVQPDAGFSFAPPTGSSATPDMLRLRPELRDIPLAPDPARQIKLTPASQNPEKLVAGIWNRYGGLLLTVANLVGLKPGVAVAVLAIESGGRGFGGDGRMLIRFENHIFFRQWGQQYADHFRAHFTFDQNKPWQKHQWRAATNQPWRECHGTQRNEWAVFDFACKLNEQAAKMSISMGAPQIMGFNHKTIGYPSVEEMFDAFVAGERDQLLGFFDFCCGPAADLRSLPALQVQDFETFAAIYNGPGQAAKYASLLRSAYEAFQRLNPAV